MSMSIKVLPSSSELWSISLTGDSKPTVVATGEHLVSRAFSATALSTTTRSTVYEYR